MMIRKSRAAMLAAVFVAMTACSQDLTSPAPADALFAKGGSSGPGGQSGTTLITDNFAEAQWRCVNGQARLFAVGTVSVTNGGAKATENLRIVITIESKAPGAKVWSPTGYTTTLNPATQIAAYQTETFNYEFQLTSWNQAATYRSNVQVTITNHSGSLGVAKGPNPKASFLIINEPVDLCAVTCTLGFGYWKNHGPTASGGNTNQWNVTSMTLGSVTYSAAQLQTIMDLQVGGGPNANGLISMAHQLISAKLNIAAGANASAIASTISAADALIGSLQIPPTGAGYLAPNLTSALTTALETFNQGSGTCGS